MAAKQFRNTNLLIDTGPLSLLLVGCYKKESLNNCDIDSQKFDKTDFDMLFQYLKGCNLFVTPHILAETNNIVKRYVGKNEFYELMKSNTIFLKNRLLEIYVKKDEILENGSVLKFGITDISVFLASKNKAVLTTDRALRDLCTKNKIEAYHLLDDITFVKWTMS